MYAVQVSRKCVEFSESYREKRGSRTSWTDRAYISYMERICSRAEVIDQVISAYYGSK